MISNATCLQLYIITLLFTFVSEKLCSVGPACLSQRAEMTVKH